ncbi:MAG: MotA/TolQ/ExbB proton channel family protein, partial [Pirellulaceae bacterium]
MTLVLLLGVLVGTVEQFPLWAQAPAEAATEPVAGDTGPSGFLEIVFAGGISSFLILIVLLGLSLTAAYLVFE